MLDESVFSSIMCLSPWCGKRSGINISLINHNHFFVNFQIIGNNILVFLYGYVFLSSLLYIRYLNDFTILLTLQSTVVPYVGLHTLLNFLFFLCDLILLSFSFNVNLCGPTILGSSIGCRTTSVKTTLSNRLIVGSTWSGVNWSWN